MPTKSKKSMRAGGGGRFAKLTAKLKRKGKTKKQAKAIAAKVGRAKYGKTKMKKWAKAGAKRAAGKRKARAGRAKR